MRVYLPLRVCLCVCMFCCIGVYMQLQEVDSYGRTTQCSGFHLITIPFKEDMRAPSLTSSVCCLSPSLLSLLKDQTKTERQTQKEYQTPPHHALTTQETNILQLTKQLSDILKRKP